MREIFLEITNEYIKQSSTFGGVQGAGNVTAVILCFDKSWDGFAKTLTWFNAHGGNPVQQILGIDKAQDGDGRAYRVTVPPEALKEWGTCSLVIEGHKDHARAKSLTAHFEVEPCADTSYAAESQDPTPTIAEQLQGEIEDIRETIFKAEESAAAASNAADQAQGYTTNPPYPADKVWYLWNGTEYVKSSAPSVGEQGEKGDKGDTGLQGPAGADGKDGVVDYSLVANALRGSTSGNAIALDDVSPFEHTLGVKARSKNIVKPPFEVSGTNTLNGVTYTINEDYSITASGKPTAAQSVAVRLTDNIDITAYRGKTANIIPRAGTTCSYLYVHLWYDDGTATYNYLSSTKTTTMIIPDNASHFEIGIAFLSSFSGEETTIYPFIQIGEAATEYVPYVDVRGAKVMAFGKNLIPYPFTTFSAGTESGVKEIEIEDMGDGGVLLNSINGQPTTETTYVNISNIPLSSRGITDAGYQGFISSKTDDPNVTVAYNSSNDITFIRIIKNTLLDNFIVYPQIEKGMVSTAFEKGKPYTEYIPLADGTVEGVQSISPDMTLLTDTSGVVLDVQYNKDINKTIETLTQAIASLGGNV